MVIETQTPAEFAQHKVNDFMSSKRIRRQLKHESIRKVDASTLEAGTVLLVFNKTYIFNEIRDGEYGKVVHLSAAGPMGLPGEGYTHDLRSFELEASVPKQ